jgi:eukaryotic-like serine/threonine-protein kinase
MTASSRDDTGLSAALLKRLEGLMALSPEDRQAELELLAATDPDLARRLQRLLSHVAEAETWLGDFEQTLARGLASELDSAWAPGRVIGPYRLERLLATGGMDAVFLARKADGELKRPVALKLVPPGLINEDTLARFRQERDLLAALAHPNIAQLLDAGITDAEQPWFAMEFIDGERFLDWCRQTKGGLVARVGKFLDLVDAVQFAHRNLVVHGDIKPGNVMVGRNGRLRLLDFGIARLLNEVPADGAVRYFTARYAAPEASAGQGPTISSDIYSLGVMLTELIDLPGSASSSSRSSPPIGELRCIAERATRDDPSDRYESARQIGDEIRRWLRFEPVDAWQGGALYRFGKRRRRHPWASLGIAAALVAVIGFGGYSRIQAERFAAQRDSARQLAEFMEQVLLGSDPEIARDGNLSARALLNRGLEGLGPELAAGTPASAVRARFASIMGRTYQRLGDYPTARRLLEEALDSGMLDRAQRIEANLELADNHYLAGQFDAAESVYREQLEKAATDAEKARALTGLARALSQTGRPGEAVELLDRSIALTRADPSVAAWRLAQRLNDAGSARFRLGQYDEATAMLEEALAIRRTLDGNAPDQSGSPATATLLNNLGLMHYLNGSSDRARPALAEALTLRRDLLAPDHPDLAQTLTNLGLMEKDYGDIEKAVRLLREALEVRRRALEPDHYRIGQAMLNLAIALRDSGDAVTAEGLFGEALTRLVERLGADHPQVAVAHTELGTLWLETSRSDLAEEAFLRSLEIRRAALPDGHPHLAWSLLGLGRSLLASTRREEALPLLREAVEIRQRALPPGNPLRQLAEATLRDAEQAAEAGALP